MNEHASSDDPTTSEEALRLYQHWYDHYVMASFFNADLAEKNRQKCQHYGELYEALKAKELGKEPRS